MGQDELKILDDNISPKESNVMSTKRFFSIALSIFFILCLASALAQELPKPGVNNALVVSIEHGVQDSTEVDYIKNNFNFGLYAWLSFSHTTLTPSLAWHSDWADASNGIQAFKDSVNALIEAAKAKGVRIHIVITSGLARRLLVYHEAKDEDVRNAQWYNDNNIASDTQILDAGVMDKYVFGTLSRYARKVRDNLEAKMRAVVAFLKQRMTEEPGTLLAVSALGEAELNYLRIDQTKSIQDFFCDYSPFAVLEFRDWIQRAGLYDDAIGKYKGQGYSQGGIKYQGAGGLAQFNADFGTSFTTWDLRCFNWTLADDYDLIPQDYVNNDPHRIPFASYVQGGMRPAAGANYIAGGFDPPRVMQPEYPFYDLWNLFRESMVGNFVLDAAKWARDAGIPADRWYSHQIPADYLFGSSPSNPNPRFYSSASPIRTANIVPYGTVGATIYDVKFPTWFARTTQNVYPIISVMSANWAMLEYDAEVYPQDPGWTIPQSDPGFILDQYLRAYSYSPRLINFWRWIDASGESQIKGMNKETALRNFVQRIRDKARNPDLTVVYTPPKVVGLSGQYMTALAAPGPAAGNVTALAAGIKTQVTGKIWATETWDWKTWGDFSYFEVYRGNASGFAADDAHYLGRTTEYFYNDASAVYGNLYSYRWRAVNSAGVRGPLSDELQVVASTGSIAILTIDKRSLVFGAEAGKASTVVQAVLIKNTGSAGTVLNWAASADQPWILLTPRSGTGNGVLEVRVDPLSQGIGTVTGKITIQDPNAAGSPQMVDVTLNVYYPGGDGSPFGSFDTPLDGKTGVTGSIAVTGWALDDIEVASLKIYRDPVGGEQPGSNGYIYVGEAVFVAGARRDVEAAYSTFPKADRAGWGYMMLTNFMPNLGNGTYVLHAIAADSSGHSVELGQKTMTCDNAHIVKPFGAIDTPTQGGNASGAAFNQFGWALTPQPKTIPVDGSTIQVFVDGLPIGNPAYGYYRADVSLKFTGYNNSNGPVGVFSLDTTAYANGVHTIAWSVTDNQGATDGIGSRFFNVVNTGAPGVAATEETASSLPLAFTRVSELSGIAADLQSPILVITGFDLRRALVPTSPDPEGRRIVEIEELGRVELHVGDIGVDGVLKAGAVDGRNRRTGTSERVRTANTDNRAYLVVGDEWRSLPIGSTFDAERSIFYWQPGPGFLGDYDFVFIRSAESPETQGIKRPIKTFARIKIMPQGSIK
jgi:hypothetical protein